jgi:uncharacterized membrane protein SpoIIM required for sporulation
MSELKIDKGIKLLINQFLSFVTIIMVVGYIAGLRLVFNHFGAFEIMVDLISIIFIMGTSIYYCIRNDRKYIFHFIYSGVILYCATLTRCYVSTILLLFSSAMIGVIFYSMLELVCSEC